MCADIINVPLTRPTSLEMTHYAVEVHGMRKGKPAGWRARVIAVALLPIRDGRVVISRYRDAPTLSERIQDRAQDAVGAQKPERAREIVEDFA